MMAKNSGQAGAGEAIDTHHLIAVAAELESRPAGMDDQPADDAVFQDFVGTLRNWIVDHYALPGTRLERVEKTHLLVHLMVGASTLGDALTLLERFRLLVWGDRGIRVISDDQTTTILFDQPGREGPPGLLSDLWSLSFMLTELEFLVGGALGGVEGRVRQPACLPPSTARLLFARPVVFGEAALVLTFPTSQLRRPVVAQTAQIDDFLAALVPRTVGVVPRPNTLASLVAGLIQAETRHAAGPPANLEGVAQQLGLSVATLRRRLADEGFTFRDIREQVLDELATGFLTAGLSVEAIAERLGYSDAFAFRRAFHRRRRCSPSAYRSGHPSGAGN